MRVEPDLSWGVHLERTDERVAEIAALSELLDGSVGLSAVLGDLNRSARRSYGVLGRGVHRAYTWDAADRRSQRWWPQGITSSADAARTADDDAAHGRRVLAVSWYAKESESADVRPGSRVTFVDLDTLRYRHVLLVVPSFADGVLRLDPLRVHAGGMVWFGDHLHVAATARGLMSCRLDDIMRIPDDRGGAHLAGLGIDGDEVASYGYRYVLPVRFTYRAQTEGDGARLRYSFLSLDRTSSPPCLVAGEYGRGGASTRLARFPLDDASSLLETGTDGRVRPLELDEGGVAGMQGAAVVDGRWHVTVSHGPFYPGSVYVGAPGDLRQRRWVTPMGPEDIAYWPSTGLLWSLTEHPHRRWFYSMRADWFRTAAR